MESLLRKILFPCFQQSLLFAFFMSGKSNMGRPNFSKATPHSAPTNTSWVQDKHTLIYLLKNSWSLMSLISLSIERQKLVLKVLSSVTCLKTLNEWGPALEVEDECLLIRYHLHPFCAGIREALHWLTQCTEYFLASRPSLRFGSAKQPGIQIFNSSFQIALVCTSRGSLAD